MSDNEVSNNKRSDNSDTEKKEAATLSSGTSTTKTSATDNKNAETKKAAITKPEPKQSTTNTATKKPSPSSTKVSADKPSNKTATIALVVAIISIFASVGHYLWQQQQTSAQLLTLNQQNQRAIEQGQAQLKSNLTAEFNRQLQQQNRATSQSQINAKKAHSDSNSQLQQLTAQFGQLERKMSLRQPNDWLIHEAEYLVRVAARTMWLERDTKAAINLLRDADNRLKALNQPKFLPVRALINEDIESLALMPTLQNQEAILTLMALNKQVPTLMLAGVNLAEALDQTEEELALSDNIGDWQENLAKTWNQFLKDFITVRRRTGMVEPLMAPDQQQHLKQNLSLKVQLAQWAASEQKEEIYQQTLLDIQQWLNEFFDMNLPVNERFYQSVEQLKQQIIYYDYPSDLRSLAAIKRLLQESKQGARPEKPKSAKATVKPAKKQPVEKIIEPSSEAKANLESEEESGGQL
ncbi:uroporphyrinogen-III C-methyltransferase [Colwellia psychrerythraea]|uniref:Uroporphyrinogen-III C-methyltransferase n=1 Tax=Colwellia psychrerythraea TaxID=28229 RepID=A0A099KS74_COLPS|nr:uroporphyrinogen-III C-methyltransferase [Colwellia psychrerythraea]KGJ92513.1 Uroporphyrinogen-III C-methyltransferase [Colwellia psychrerythraea]